ncbi:uncharacterized protein ACNLHF_019340 [Anomaloglossus baeobatrachus]
MTRTTYPSQQARVTDLGQKWAHVYRTGTQQLGINTNNGLEKQHQTLKHSYISSQERIPQNGGSTLKQAEKNNSLQELLFQRIIIIGSLCFDSSSISDTLKKLMLKVYKPHFHGINHILHVTILCCQKQIGANDCGLFSIANAVGLAEGRDVKNVEFNQAEVRNHRILSRKGSFGIISLRKQAPSESLQINSYLLQCTAFATCTRRMSKWWSVYCANHGFTYHV